MGLSLHNLFRARSATHPWGTARRLRVSIVRPRLEVLEDRCLLSVGAVGDSITLPYFGRNGTAHNWVEELVNLRGINFGGLSSTSGGTASLGPNGYVGTGGYANDWSGPNTYGALAAGAPALAQQIKAGQVNLAAVELGNHDFIWYPRPQGPAPYEDAGNTSHWILGDIFSGALSAAPLQTYSNQVITNLGKVLDTLQSAGTVSLVAFNIGDISTVPGFAALRAANPAGARAYTAAIAAADAQYQALANQDGVPLLDLLGFGQLVHSGAPFVVGGVTLDVNNFSNPANPYDFFADSQHPGTVASGLLANMFIAAADNAYGAGIAPLSDQEILQYAGITPPPSPSPTYYDVSRFVIYPTPTLSGLSASTAPEGSPVLTLLVNGRNLLSSSQVQWNGTPLATTFVSGTQLKATIPAANLAEHGTATVTVVNPTPGGGTSNGATFTVTEAPLNALGVNVAATAGAPFSGTVASFTDANSAAALDEFAATIDWGDGSTSPGAITARGDGGFQVAGCHTYAAAGRYAVHVQIADDGDNRVTADSTARVTNLGRPVREGQSAGIGFWHNKNGQALINHFNGGRDSTALADWLAASFPNLYGANAGANNLTGKTNAQVTAFYLTLFHQPGLKLDAQVLATALNVYATTQSLGGTAAAAYGFAVYAYGLGAASQNVGFNGAAFGVASHTTLNVYQILLAVNRQARNGVLYNGDAKLAHEANKVFTCINGEEGDRD